MASALASLRLYREPRLLEVLLMGFSSGLPLGLTGATLTFWLSEAGVSRAAIGLFALVGFSYNYKFLWSPFLDRVPLPFLTARLGRRRSWALFIQLLLALAIFALGQTDPRLDLGTMAAFAVAVAFLSASQDIVIDAYRIELLRPEEQGAGAAATQWGYRFGMIAAGAGALYIADFVSWGTAYLVMALLMGVGMATVLLTPEPTPIRPRLRPARASARASPGSPPCCSAPSSISSSVAAAAFRSRALSCGASAPFSGAAGSASSCSASSCSTSSARRWPAIGRARSISSSASPRAR